MRALLDLQIVRDLAAHGLSEADYDVLSTLSEHENAQMRVGELARWMLWSQSRLSHHLTRMQARGLVHRTGTAGDGRGAIVSLSEDGWTVLRTAAPSHVQSVRDNFIDVLTPAQPKAVGAAAQRVVKRLSPDRPGLDHPSVQRPTWRRRVIGARLISATGAGTGPSRCRAAPR
jgi:DNA-binding MarR family transcriptional regulator